MAARAAARCDDWPRSALETILVDFWLEYLRVLERATRADIELLDAVKRFRQGAAPRVSRFLAA